MSSILQRALYVAIMDSPDSIVEGTFVMKTTYFNKHFFLSLILVLFRLDVRSAFLFLLLMACSLNAHATKRTACFSLLRKTSMSAIFSVIVSKKCARSRRVIDS